MYYEDRLLVEGLSTLITFIGFLIGMSFLMFLEFSIPRQKVPNSLMYKILGCGGGGWVCCVYFSNNSDNRFLEVFPLFIRVIGFLHCEYSMLTYTVV